MVTDARSETVDCKRNKAATIGPFNECGGLLNRRNNINVSDVVYPQFSELIPRHKTERVSRTIT